MEIVIEAATDADVNAIAAIYNHYILTSIATFEESALHPDEVAMRIRRVKDASLPWLVARPAGAETVVGYCYARHWHDRSAYRYSVETSLYVAPEHLSKGVGTRMYMTLLAELQARRLRTALGGVALPNAASVALHERLGFKKVAHLQAVGFKFNTWIDVVYFQLNW